MDQNQGLDDSWNGYEGPLKTQVVRKKEGDGVKN